MSKALVVLSGGQDSVTCLALAIQQYGRDNVHALTFDYGQRHRAEIAAAGQVTELAGVFHRHEFVELPSGILAGSSPLTDKSAELETYEDFDTMSATIGDRVEKTFVPGRNLLFLSIAANRAAVLGCTHIVTGVCEEDGANYPDCTQDFISSIEDAINWGLGIYQRYNKNITDAKDQLMRIDTPLMHRTKAETVQLALETPGAYALLSCSHTAYDGQYPPVGKDHASLLRANGFGEAGVADPLVLRAVAERKMHAPDDRNYDPIPVRLAIGRLTESFIALQDGYGDIPEWLPVLNEMYNA